MVSIVVGLIAIISFAVSVDRGANAMEAGNSKALSAVEEERKKNGEQDELLAQQAAQYAALAPMIENIYKRGLIVQGKALVLDVGDEPYVELNTRGPGGPTRLKGFEFLHITNITHPDMFSEEMEIGGSFSNATSGYVMNLSKAAGELLHARPGTWIEIRAEPVFPEESK